MLCPHYTFWSYSFSTNSYGDILDTHDGSVLTTFILDMDCVAGPTVSQLGSTKIPQGCRPSYENLMWLVGKHHYIISS